MKLRIKALIAALLAVIGAIAIGLTAAIYSIDVNRFKPEIVSAVKHATGRNFVIRGDMQFALTPNPQLKIAGVTLANAKWGSRPTMISIGELDAEIRLLPLILGGNVRIERLELRKVDLSIETDRQGRGNWEFGSDPAPADTAPSEDGVAILSDLAEVRLRNIVVTYKDGQTGGTARAAIGRFDARPVSEGKISIRLNATYNGKPVEMRGTMGSMEELLAPTRPWPISLDVAVVGVKARFDGAIDRPMAAEGIGIKAVVEGDDLGRLQEIGGPPLPAGKRYRLAATIQGDAMRRLTIKNLQGNLGGSNLAGEGRLVLDREQPRLEARLTSTLLNVGDFAGRAADDAKIPPKLEPPGVKIFSDQAFPVDFLRAADADIAMTANEARWGKLRLQKISFHLGLQNGVATIKSIQSNLAGGKLSGQIRLDAKGENPAATFTLKLMQFDVGKMWRLFEGEDIAEGRADIELDLKGSGNSTRAVMAGLSGHVDAVMHQGRLHSRYAELIKADLLLALLPGEQYVDPTINCFIGRFDVKEGIANASVLILDTTSATVRGQGEINLATEQFDMTLKPRPKEASLTSFAVPLDVRGPLSDPSVQPNSEAVALGVAGAMATTVIGPFGLLIPLLSIGSGDKTPCPAALAAVRGEEPAVVPTDARDEPAAGAAPAKSPESPVAPKSEEGGGFFRGIGRSLEGLGRTIDRLLDQPERK